MSKKQIEMINNYDDKKKYLEIDEELNKLKIFWYCLFNFIFIYQ